MINLVYEEEVKRFIKTPPDLEDDHYYNFPSNH